MYPFLFSGLAFACAGGICALIGDLQKRAYLGLSCFLVVNTIAWGRFVYHLFSIDLMSAASLFLLSQAAATCAYLGAVYFLDAGRQPAVDGLVALHE